MGALKRMTKLELDEDAGLYETVLSRMVEAPHARDDPGPHWQLQSPWEVCREMGLSYGALIAWINADETGTRMQQFRNVQEIRAQLLAEQTLPIADEATDTAKARLQVDTRFRLAKAYNPRVFGEAQPTQSAPVSISIGLLWDAAPQQATQPDPVEALKVIEGEVAEEVSGGAHG